MSNSQYDDPTAPFHFLQVGSYVGTTWRTVCNNKMPGETAHHESHRDALRCALHSIPHACTCPAIPVPTPTQALYRMTVDHAGFMVVVTLTATTNLVVAAQHEIDGLSGKAMGGGRGGAVSTIDHRVAKPNARRCPGGSVDKAVSPGSDH